MLRGRFAPSPTGQLHLGNARTALLAWLSVKSAGGKFLLRIEDLDASRCRPEYVDALFRDLEYLGLLWDEAPWFQSQRTPIYEEALARLQNQGRLYPCFCTRAEIAHAVSAPHQPSDDGPVYPGTCAHLTPQAQAFRSQTRAPALRFRPTSETTVFQDALHGVVESNVSQEVGDFVVRRNDGVASYQLAVVVDDAASQISEVLRGDDLLSSTARQIQIYQALECAPPAFVHVPLVMGEDGKRLAKRHGASTVAALREAKVPCERVIGLLARWSGLGDGSPLSALDLVNHFSLARLSKVSSVARETELYALLA